MRTLFLLAALAAAPVASAADHELNVEVGALALTDRAYDSFSNSRGALGLGVRGAFAFHEHFAVQAGWHHVRTGAQLWAQESYVGNSAYFGNEVLLGVRFDWPIRDLFVPYTHLDGLLWISDARFDFHTSDPNSPEQTRETALSGGGRGMLGVEFRIPRKTTDGFTGAIFLEGGYTVLTAARFETIGSLRLSGATVRTGIGLRY